MSSIAFIGAGRMASAIVHGLVQGGHYAPASIACTCGDDPTGPDLAQRTGITYEPDPVAMASAADIVVLACKPQQFAQLSSELAQALAGKLVLSILAGTPLARLTEKFPSARNHVRAMPNTPGQIGAGITAYASASTLEQADAPTVQTILGALGEVVPLPEGQIDAVTAISGSGPAYVFEFTAALREAATALGLDAETAHQLALHTVTGAARLMEHTEEDPDTLRNNVTSPGGTTQAALESMRADDFRGLVRRATTAARDRSIELANS